MTLLAWQTHGRLLVSGGADGSVAFWDPERSRTPLYEISLDEAITAAAWDSKDRAVVIGSASGQIEVWDLA